MGQQIVAAIILSLCSISAFACQPLGMTYDELKTVYQNQLQGISNEQRPDYLRTVVPCYGSTDPFLRDQIGYEATAALLRREGALDKNMINALDKFKDDLIALLAPEAADPHGVTKPFAVIVLAEVARTDRIHKWMNDAERLELITQAQKYLTGITDYRAYEDGIGFRHGVAHSADLILQLALNTQIEPINLKTLVTAIGSQISTSDGTAYTTGEPGRLVRALFYLLQRAADSEPLRNEILALLNRVKDPAPFENWGAVFASEEGLAHRHNHRAFAEALYVQLMPHAEHEVLAPYVDAISETVKAIP